MKLKGISSFEQHVEKIVFGAAVLGVAGIAAWQVINAPTVKLGSQDVSPSEVDERLQKKAETLQARLRGESDIKVPTEGVPLAAESFGKSLSKPVSPVQSLARTSPSFNGMLVRSGNASADVWYFEPGVKQLEMVAVHETADALTKEAAEAAEKASPILAERWGKVSGATDLVWATPVARIDLKAIRAELARADKEANPPRSSIPGVWYQETPFIVDVVFERREKHDDGSWSAPKAVPVFSARAPELEFRSKIAGAKAELRDEVFSLLGVPEQQLDVLQLPFYDTVNGAFVSPSVLLAGAEPGTSEGARDSSGEIRKRMQLRTQLEQKQRRAETLRTELQKLGGLWNDEQEKAKDKERKDQEQQAKDSQKGSGGGGGGGGSGGLGGAMKGKNSGGGAKTDAEEGRIRTLRKAKTAELKRTEADIASLEKQLGAEPTTQASTKPKAPSVATADELLVWGHDLEVEPGKTYQYRCVARVFNPFFGKENQLVKDQAAKGLANAFTLDSQPSAWSAETTISPNVRFFVTKASVGDGSLQGGTAQVEVYRLLDGQWRRSEMTVQPGERIGRKDARSGAEVDFTTDYFLVGVVEDIEGKSSGSKGERRPGFAVIRSISTPDVEVRNPTGDIDDPDRLKLRSQADAAVKPDAKDAPADAPAGGGRGLGGGAGGTGPGGPGGGPGGGASGSRGSSGGGAK